MGTCNNMLQQCNKYELLDEVYGINEVQCLNDLISITFEGKLTTDELMSIYQNNIKYKVIYQIIKTDDISTQSDVKLAFDVVLRLLKPSLTKVSVNFIQLDQIPQYDIIEDNLKSVFVFVNCDYNILERDPTKGTDIFLFTQKIETIPSNIKLLVETEQFQLFYRL